MITNQCWAAVVAQRQSTCLIQRGHGFESCQVQGFFPSLSHQWCVLNQVPHGGATLLIFLKKYWPCSFSLKCTDRGKNLPATTKFWFRSWAFRSLDFASAVFRREIRFDAPPVLKSFGPIRFLFFSFHIFNQSENTSGVRETAVPLQMSLSLPGFLSLSFLVCVGWSVATELLSMVNRSKIEMLRADIINKFQLGFESEGNITVTMKRKFVHKT